MAQARMLIGPLGIWANDCNDRDLNSDLTGI